MIYKTLRLNMLEDCRMHLILWDKSVVPESLIDTYNIIFQTSASCELNVIYDGMKKLNIPETSTLTKASLKLAIKYVSDKFDKYIRKSSETQSDIMSVATIDGKKHACHLSLSYLYTILNIYESRELQNYKILSQLRAAPGSGKLYLSSDPVIRQYKEVLSSHKDEFEFSVEPGSGINRGSTVITYASRL